MNRLFQFVFLATVGFGMPSISSASGVEPSASDQPTILMPQQNYKYLYFARYYDPQLKRDVRLGPYIFQKAEAVVRDLRLAGYSSAEVMYERR